MPDAAHPRPGRARPVADAPVAALAGAADELAREWLLALLAEIPLEAAGGVPVAELAREAPRLCAAMAHALASDAELERLRSGDLAAGAAAAGRLAGAASPAEVAQAVELLRAVLWTAAVDELRRPDPRLIGDLADRLSAVAAVVTAAALGAGEPAAPAREPAPQDGPGAADRSRAGTPIGEPGHGAAGPHAPWGSGPPGPHAPWGADRPGPHAPWGSDRPGPHAAPASAPPAAAGPWTAREAALAVQAAVAGGLDVRARDLRPRIVDGDPLAALASAVDEHRPDRRTFAVLLAEVDGAERLLAAQLDGEAAEAIARAEEAIEELLRQGDGACREAPGRLWITLPGTGPAGARALGLRVSAAIGRAAQLRGVPLTASIGIAVYPVDAGDAAALAGHAEEALFEARASGR